MIKIVHCADIHLGAKLDSLYKIAGENITYKRRYETRKAFSNIIEFVKTKKVDLLLIAGDLFENNYVDEVLVSETINLLKQIPETYVAISPGNHDCFYYNSIYSRYTWPENTIIFSGEMEQVVLDDIGVKLCGAGFLDVYQEESMFKTCPINDNYLNICVIHADIVSRITDSKYNPVTVDMIGNSGFEYVALGHIHKRTEPVCSNGTYYAYSGCPQGQGFDELGDKGIYYIEMTKDHFAYSYVKTSIRDNCIEEINIAECNNNNDVIELIYSKIGKYNNFEENLYKISLVGEIDFDIDIVSIEKQLMEKIYFVHIVDKVTDEIDYEKLSREKSLRGIFVSKMLSRISEANTMKEQEQLKRALNIGAQAFSNEVYYNENL